MLAAALAVAGFFVAWAILNAIENEMPLVSAGLLASMILAGAVVLREIIFRSARYRLILAQEKIDHNVKSVKRNLNLQKPDKITLEENQAILYEIEKRSRLARNLPKSAENHWQVFEICHEYLNLNERELSKANVGSPRVNVLRKSREKIQTLHKYHLMMWSSLESRALVQEAKISATIAKKLESANKAMTVLDSAREFYPGEKELADSITVVKEFITTVKVSHWTEQAERAAFKGNYKRAINHYRDALFFLARENIQSEDKNAIAEKINSEIEIIRKRLAE